MSSLGILDQLDPGVNIMFYGFSQFVERCSPCQLWNCLAQVREILGINNEEEVKAPAESGARSRLKWGDAWCWQPTFC